jgi:hypothetical protein
MAHFAQLNENNTVLQVIAVSNDDILVNGIESENKGIELCQSLFGENTIWKQTSYNANIRRRYAGIGFTYDQTRDAFIPPKPFPSWILNEDICAWDSPIPYPTDVGTEEDPKRYDWDEPTISWVEKVNLA